MSARQTLARAVSWATAPLAVGVAGLHPRQQRDLRERLGVVVAPVCPGALWIHASSVGEMSAAEGLLSEVTGPVLLTADTDTGIARARALAAERPHTSASALPVDHPWLLAPLFAEARPRGLVLVEGAWWPTLLAEANARGVPVLRANARSGVTSRLPGARWWGAGVDRVLARDPESARALAVLQDAPVAWVGDLKLLRTAPPNPLRWPGPFWVAASTRPADEEAVLGVQRGEPLLLAPRHLERVPELARKLSKRRWTLASALRDGVVPADIEVVLLDSLGSLAGAMRGASVVFVGGTFDPAIGGHSPAEAQALGLPVTAGPYQQGQPHLFAGCSTARDGSDLGRALDAATPQRAVFPDRAALRAILAALDRPAPESSPRPWARPLAGPVAAIAAVRRAVRRRRPASFAVPLFVVASDNPRGSGKTATARWWAEALGARGLRVGIAVRGYGRSHTARAVSWERRGSAWLGDEGARLAELGFAVAACGDLATAAAAFGEGFDGVVVDDGGNAELPFHRLLWVLDARYPTARGPLPAGERRPVAPVCGDGRVIHHHGPGFDVAPGALPDRRAKLAWGPWQRGDRACALPDGPLAVFAGLGRPIDALGDLSDRAGVALFPLADHQRVDEALAAALQARAAGRPLVCTPKDRVRLPPELAAEVWWRDARVAIEAPPDAWFP